MPVKSIKVQDGTSTGFFARWHRHKFERVQHSIFPDLGTPIEELEAKLSAEPSFREALIFSMTILGYKLHRCRCGAEIMLKSTPKAR